jgi:hypothetical protein
MKLNANKDHSDYHDIHFFVNLYDYGLHLKACTWVDLETGEYECYEQPLKVINKDEISRKTYKSEHLVLTFKDGTPEWLIKDWYSKY